MKSVNYQNLNILLLYIILANYALFFHAILNTEKVPKQNIEYDKLYHYKAQVNLSTNT